MNGSTRIKLKIAADLGYVKMFFISEKSGLTIRGN
jgi:hypothetical protein